MTRQANRLVSWAAFLAVLLMAATGLAQTRATNFKELRLKVGPGDTIFITGPGGGEFASEVIEVSDSTLAVRRSGERRDLGEADVTRIRQRLPDGLWTGAIIGAGVGLGLGALAVGFSEECSHTGGMQCAGPALTIGAIGTGIGVGIDALIKGRKVIYERPGGGVSAHLTVAPAFSANAKAVRMTWLF